MLPIERLRELFDCDVSTGELTWRGRPREDFANRQAWLSWNTRFEGKLAGCRDTRVQVTVTINGVHHQMFVHRVIWALVHGHWPIDEIDHRNGNGLDNRLSNLREATHAENLQNRRLMPTQGASFDTKRGRFQTSIRVKGKRVRLGRFATAEEARAAYLAAKARLHPFQPVPREMVA
jgi:hypothetical protein